MASFPAVINLSSLDGSNGFKISGEAAGDIAGWSVASAGDINGDGFADTVIGAWGAQPYGSSGSGAAYVVFGKPSGWGANFALSSLNGSNGFQIDGQLHEGAGRSVSSAGDVNRDGLSDFLIGAGDGAYVVFGAPSGFPSDFNVSLLDGTNGLYINGVPPWFLSSAGDVNGDGFVDLLAGDLGGYSGANDFLIFGNSSGFPATIVNPNNSLALDGSNGLRIGGFSYYGGQVSSAGDVNGDGFDDFIVGALDAGANGAGAAYVVIGHASGFPPALYGPLLDGTNGFRINGEAKNDFFGESVASAGDFNGDGFDDVIIGAAGADPNGNSSGDSYVVFGHASGFAASLDASSLNGANGVRINGEAAGDYSGAWVGPAGDVNGDGFADLIVGATGADPNGTGSGSSYVVFGRPSGFGAVLNLSSLDGSNGFRINGEAAKDYSGVVSGGGDINGDGFDDVLIGAPRADPNGTDSGAAYVVFGHATGITPGTSPVFETDFSNDGRSDLLWQNNSGEVAIWLLNGINVAAQIFVANAGPSWRIAGSGDFNADGESDILLQNVSGQTAIWLLNGTTISSGAVLAANPGPSWHIKSAGDFNGDGKSDILWQNDVGQAAIWLMNGTGLVAGALIGTLSGPSWHVEGAADFNGDGKSDILWQNDNGQAAISLLNGTNLISDTLLTNPGPSWHVKGAGDFNADGKSDVLWQNDSGQAAIWFLNGTTLINGAFVDSNPGTSSHIMGTGEFNADGKSDILWQNDSAQASIWLLDSSHVVARGDVGSNPGPTWHLDWS